MKRSLSLLIVVVITVAVFVAFTSASSSSLTTFDESTKCIRHKYLTLDDKRLSLFYKGMGLSIEKYAKKYPKWFVNHENVDDDECVVSYLSSNNNKNYQGQDPSNPIAECWEFLLRWMPQQDTSLPLQFFMDTISYALRARNTFVNAKNVPWPLFLNEVLPYSVLTENRDPWRPQFFEYFASKYKTELIDNSSLSAADMFVWLNTNAWKMTNPPIHYAACDADKICYYSPFQVLNNGNASCTGLAIFLIACTRSVGMPIRLTGTPHWHFDKSKCPQGDESDDCGNHDWSEVFADEIGGWSFNSPAGNVNLNQSWFFPDWTEHQSPAESYSSPGNHSIFATSWASSEYLKENYGNWYDPLATPHNRFPMVWDWNSNTSNITSSWDVTKRYLSMEPKY